MSWDQDTLERLKQWLRTGESGRVLLQLRKRSSAQLPQRLRAEFADVARQAGAPQLSLRWLSPTVRPTRGRAPSATPREVSVYAASLVKIGATEEALGLLEEIEAKDDPESLLFKAHAYIAQWDYAKAIPVLETLLAGHDLPPERQLVTKLNLLASLIVEARFPEAVKLLEWLDTQSAAPAFHFYRAIVMELAAQLSIRRKDWSSAENFLKQGEALVGNRASLQAFFLRKWTLVMEARRQGDFEPFKARWNKLRQEAEGLKHWESLRDLDHLKGTLLEDKKVLLHLYFGTPFESFRVRLFQGTTPLSIPESYGWRLGKMGGTPVKVDCLKLASDSGLKPWSNHSKLLALLTSDFYRPLRVGMLHAGLYPKEYFNPDSSPRRVYQALAEFRRFLTAAKLPIETRITSGGYQLASDEPALVVVPRTSRWKELDPLSRLQEKFPSSQFNAQQASELLGCSRATVSRLLREAVEEKRLVRSGGGPETRFSFEVPVKKAA